MLFADGMIVYIENPKEPPKVVTNNWIYHGHSIEVQYKQLFYFCILAKNK